MKRICISNRHTFQHLIPPPFLCKKGKLAKGNIQLKKKAHLVASPLPGLRVSQKIGINVLKLPP
ncbi:hypothetical protein E2C01_074670 [Portunus trituberculatus]|uniref:Uncharacterized protein n=1 Tax=Portunus trituberculatus TaxID=210409 RepID=A0A5B7ICV8_PORTR|nr:hypothetical protein [Portunus trituberculatus]